MNIETLKKIGESSIQVLTLVSLIVGIYLVVAEIRQSRAIAALTLIHGKELSELESQAILAKP